MVNHRVERSHGESASEYDSFTPCQLEAQGPSNTTVLQSNVETISLKLTKEQARLLEKTAREEGFPSKSEFVRYALARARGPAQRRDNRGDLRSTSPGPGGEDGSLGTLEGRGMKA